MEEEGEEVEEEVEEERCRRKFVEGSRGTLPPKNILNLRAWRWYF